MAKNANANKEVVDKHEADLQPVQETSGADNVAPAAPGEYEGGEKELSISPESGDSKKTDDGQHPELDSESKTETVGEKRGEVSDQLNDHKEVKEAVKIPSKESLEELSEPKEKTEPWNRIAADVFAKNAQCKELFFTADLVPFFSKSDAFRHAGTLKDDTIVTVNKK